MPGSAGESWTLLGDDLVPFEPVDWFLTFLTDVERSPNTVKAYVHDLKDWLTYLAGRHLDWREVRARGRRRVRGLAAASAAPGTGRACGGVALDECALQRGDGEPEAVRGQRVLPARGAE